MKLSSVVAATAGAFLATTLAPVLSGAALAAPASAAAEPAAVPAGSYLAVVERGPDGEYGGLDARTQRLELVSPTGEERTVYERRVSRTYGGFTLLDWSVDGTTALLTTIEHRDTVALRVDVATGAVQELPVPLLQTAVLAPDGTGIVAVSWKGRRSNVSVLDRISWTGDRTRLRDRTGGSVVVGRAGTLVVSAPRGRRQLVLDATDGSVVRSLRGHGYCNPVRWWDATRLLESCGRGGDLFLVDPATGAASRLTHGHGRGDYGHLDARQVGSRLFVQVGGACGYTYVGQVTRNGSTRHLRVPGAVGNVVMVDAVGSDLVLQHAASCDGDRPRAVLSRFDPVHHEETPLVVLGRHEAFGRILVLGEIRASAY